MSLKKVVLLFVLLGVGGCAGSGQHKDDAAYRDRQKCQNTAIGSETEKVCY